MAKMDGISVMARKFRIKQATLWVALIAIGIIALGAVQVTNLLARAPQPVIHQPAPRATSTAKAVTPKPAAQPRVSTVAVTPADNELVIRRVLKIDGPFKHGDYVWDDAGVPDGPVVITVDVAAETLSVFRGGYEIGAAVILFGATDKPTPLGVFPITQKKKDHISNLYNAPMPYMMRLTNDGVAIHGSKVEWGGATHGCIGVPIAFAAKLFSVAKLGDKVIVTKGQMMDVSGLKAKS